MFTNIRELGSLRLDLVTMIQYRIRLKTYLQRKLHPAKGNRPRHRYISSEISHATRSISVNRRREQFGNACETTQRLALNAQANETRYDEALCMHDQTLSNKASTLLRTAVPSKEPRDRVLPLVDGANHTGVSIPGAMM